MRNTNVIRVTLIVASIVFAASHVSASEKLSDILVKAKWDGIIGTWVDADSKGAALKTTYAWKIEDQVIEVTQYQGQKKDVGLMGVNGKTGEVFYMGASSDGTSSLGKWKVDDNGDAVLGFGFTTGDGHEGVLSIRHHLADNDTMIVTIQLDQPIKFKMIRAESRK